MMDKKLVNILLDGVIVFSSMALGAKLKEIQYQAALQKLQVKMKDSIIDGQQKIIEKLMEDKETEES